MKGSGSNEAVRKRKSLRLHDLATDQKPRLRIAEECDEFDTQNPAYADTPAAASNGFALKESMGNA